ncbi:MAG: FkbM family methyltransferase [Phycisphaerae bacterium]|nr:FkbM family methyltransferase [Phycisphaerae bacterium]
MIVFDMGANLGQYTLLAAKCVGKAGHVHSFEPSSRMFSELEFNVSLNKISDICTLNKMAVSDMAGTSELSKYEPGFEVFASLGSNFRQSESLLGYEEVKTIRLDDYIENAGIDRVDFMKIDIEGAELLALRGAEKLLSRSNAPAILLELADINTDGFGYKATEIWDYLRKFGYSMYHVGKHGILSKQSERPLDFTSSQDMVAIKTV